MYNDEMIEEVREYLNDNNDVAIDCLENIGEGDWCEVYSLYDLYREYCNGELDEVINLFVDSGMNATSYYRYYVRDDEVKDEDDMCYDIEDILDDDDIVEMIIDDIVRYNVSVPDDLYNMCCPRTLEEVKSDITNAYNGLIKHRRKMLGDVEDLDYFKTVCDSVSTLTRVYNSIIRIIDSCSDDDVNILDNMVWENVLPNIEGFVVVFAKGGVTVEKAVEVWMKKNVLEG